MKNYTFIFAILLFLASCGQNVEFKPKAINFDRDNCHVCHMGLTDQRYNVQAMNDVGEVRFYDDIGCLAEALKNEKEWKTWTGTSYKIWIGDASKENKPSNWISAMDAFYSFGGDTPMGYGYSAFEVKPAGKFYSYQEVLKRISEKKTIKDGYKGE